MDTTTNNNSFTEDARKKRDSREVVEENALNVDEQQQKSKKKPRERREQQRLQFNNDLATDHNVQRKSLVSDTRALSTTTTSNAIRAAEVSAVNTIASVPASTGCTNVDSKKSKSIVAKATAKIKENTKNDDNSNIGKISLDIENALHHIVQLSDGIQEPVSSDGTVLISFRVGHAGDAAVLAKLIRQSSSSSSSSSSILTNDKNDNNNVDNNNDTKKNKIERNENPNDNCKEREEDKQQHQQDTADSATTPVAITAIGSPITSAGTTLLNSNEDTTLEVRLADGLGDEDTPPSVFALIVDVTTTKTAKSDKGIDQDGQKDSFHKNNNSTILTTTVAASNTSTMVGAALLSTLMIEQTKVLLVEWMDIVFDDKTTSNILDNDSTILKGIIERRLWLRLCTLSIILSCERIVIQDYQPEHRRVHDPTPTNNTNASKITKPIEKE
jgi:hypothetical protein